MSAAARRPLQPDHYPETQPIIVFGRAECPDLSDFEPLSSFECIVADKIDAGSIFPGQASDHAAICIKMARENCVSYLQRDIAPAASATAGLLELIDAAIPFGATHLVVGAKFRPK